MEFEEIAVLVNQAAVERKGRPLKDVERLVLKGSWENKTYAAMATPTVGYTEDYLKKDVGPKLWHLLTELVNTDRQGIRVTKRNIQNVLQTWAAQGAASPSIARAQPVAVGLPPRPPALVVRDSPRLDLADCSGRENELATLTRWVVADRCRTVVLWGLPGVGKTALAAAIADVLASQYDQCGYLAIPPDGAMADGLEAIAQWLAPAPLTVIQGATIDEVLEQLEQRRILLIIDGMEHLFAPQQLAGYYREGTEAMQQLFHGGAERQHQSCLIWVSREKPADLAQVTGLRVREYAVGDLANTAAQGLLKALGTPTANPDDWAALVERYGSHPLVLRGLGSTLREVYQGQPIALLQSPELTVPTVVQRYFTAALERLLAEEWALLYWLALAQEPVSLEHLNGAMHPPPDDGVVQSVIGRGWVLGTPADGLVLSLSAVVQSLVLARLHEALVAELESESLQWLHRLPLITMTAREVVQERQRAAVLMPLVDALKQRYATDEALATKGDRLLTALGALTGQPGYGASNLIHLFQYLGLAISGANFSNLAIYQGDLRRVSLQGANFSQAQFRDTAFATALGRNPVAAFSPDGQHLATGDHEGRLLLWNLQRGKLVWMFDEGQGQGQGIGALAFSPTSDLLAVGTETGKIWLWPVGATYQTDVLDEHQAAVKALAFSPDGSQLASGDDQGRLCLWEVASGMSQGQLDGHQGAIHSLAYSPNADHSADRLVSGGDDQRACLWHVGDRTVINSFQARSTATLCTAGFLLDPHDPTCPPMAFAAGYDEHCLTLWSLETGLPCWILPTDIQALLAMAISPNGRYLLCSRQDLAVALWDIPARRLCYTLPALRAPVWALAFSADSRYFVTGSNYTIQLWNTQRGQCWRSFLSQAHPVRCLAFSASSTSGSILTGHDDTRLRLWQVNAGSPYADGPRTLSGHGGVIRTVALSADGQWLASSADDHCIRLWSAVTGHSQGVWATATPATLLAFSPDGQWLASAGADRSIQLWDVATGTAVGDLGDAPENPSALGFSPDGRWLAVGTRDGTIGLWHWHQPRPDRAPDRALGPVLSHHTLDAHQSQVHSLAIYQHTLASASHDGTVRWWQFEPSDRSPGQNSPSPQPTAARSPQGQWQHPDEQWLQGVIYSPTGDLLAITSQDAQVEVWEVKTNQRRHRLRGHSQDIWQVSVCSSCTHLITASQDDEIRVWALESGICQQTLRPDRPYEGVNIRGATGLSDTEERMLRSLGAIVSY
ncbi:NACHT domain-containing protein [Nodosilinea sp. E11]|uniref:WD40 domain-containing protein n=1 Tax=Nodosilinea sp. E11 TaxID=3037479 RepID=UPI002934FCF2|nr:NACHT domain-containing protein [Nodosilinea sp. E11]WOD38947.1 NACHT domain-containing protein [Nodosilinea sp. E11]